MKYIFYDREFLFVLMGANSFFNAKNGPQGRKGWRNIDLNPNFLINTKHI